MKTFLIWMFLIISFSSYGHNHKGSRHKIKCKYEFGNKELTLDVGEGETQVKRTIGSDSVFIKNTQKLNDVDDYLTRSSPDGKYKMTYSLSCINLTK